MSSSTASGWIATDGASESTRVTLTHGAQSVAGASDTTTDTSADAPDGSAAHVGPPAAGATGPRCSNDTCNCVQRSNAIEDGQRNLLTMMCELKSAQARQHSELKAEQARQHSELKAEQARQHSELKAEQARQAETFSAMLGELKTEQNEMKSEQARHHSELKSEQARQHGELKGLLMEALRVGAAANAPARD